MPLTSTIGSPITSLCLVRSQDQCLKQQKNVCHTPVRVKPLCLQFHPLERNRNITHSSRVKHASVICAAALIGRYWQSFCWLPRVGITLGRPNGSTREILGRDPWNATCAAEQTQTVTRQSSTITVAPIQGKEKSPDLDDGGAGFPPRDDGDGGGGGGGGGGHWSGGFFFFGFLALLGLLKDQESEGPYYSDERRR